MISPKQKKTEAFKKGKTSGNYATEAESKKMEEHYRSIAKHRALMNQKNK
jgi:hypothetical protein